MQLLCLPWAVLAQDDVQPDPVKGWVQGVFAAALGTGGDVVVCLGILGIGIACYLKKFRAAAGCLVLICGVVILRIIINFMFGVDAF